MSDKKKSQEIVPVDPTLFIDYENSNVDKDIKSREFENKVKKKTNDDNNYDDSCGCEFENYYNTNSLWCDEEN